MDNVKELILKILKYKSNSGVDEIKVDLQRICSQGFGNSQEDIGYVNYLFKYYSQEINIINNINGMKKNTDIILILVGILEIVALTSIFLFSLK